MILASRIRTVLLSVVLLSVSSRAAADTIVLKNGRRIIALKLEGRSFIEIQKILGAASVNTVYTWDFRCRKQLRQRA